jgi:NDP-sugar pyrophosphorylase family protein
MKHDLIGCLIITYNPPLEILNKTINKLLEYKDIITTFIIDSSDNSSHLKEYIEDLNIPNLIKFEHIDNNGLQQSLNYGINKIKNKLNPEFVVIFEDDNLLITDLSEIIKLYYEMQLADKDLIVLNDRTFNFEKHTIINSKKLIGSGTYFAKSELFYNISFRNEFFMDQGDFDFQIKVRKQGGNMFITSWEVIKRLAIGREKNFIILPVWRDYLTVRNATVLFFVERNGIIFYIEQLGFLGLGFLINMKRYGVFKFLKIIFEAFVDGKNRNFDNNKVWELRKLYKK